MPSKFLPKIVACALLLTAVLVGKIGGADAQQDTPLPILDIGNAVVTGFSGVIAPDPRAPRPPNRTLIDLTFINPEGPSARIVDLASPDSLWDARLWPAAKPRDILAKDVGQVFGIALDDAPEANIYLSATSGFGLYIVKRAPDGAIERMKTGGPGAQWQNGQFGLALQGGPGGIYKVDGRTGTVSLFANVMLEGVPNPGPALGNMAYDNAHKQLFVSDLYTGMIHRFSTVDGAEPGPAFDHGVTGRPAAQLPPVPFDPRNRLNIATPRFDSTNPDSWGYAPPERRVWGLAMSDGRLYYSARNGAAAEGPQIWSVGIAKDGSFATDPRWELDVPAQPGPYPVSDIAFSQKGAMILAQRAPVAGSYDYSAFTKPAEPRVLRYWLENPDDPKTPSKWIAQPEEYAVGYAGTFRNTNGGVALGNGYGYGQNGRLGEAVCEYALWTTGQNLRNAPALRTQLEPGGPLVVHGLQGSPAGPVRNFNEPPATTYFIDYDDRFADPTSSGHLGSVRIRPCGAAAPAAYAGPGYLADPPYVIGALAGDVGGVAGGGSGGCVGPNCTSPPDPNGSPVDIAVKKAARSVRFDETSGMWMIDFRFDVTNVGDPFMPWNSIGISDPIPPGFTYVGASGTNWNCAPSWSSVNCVHHSGSASFNTGAHLSQLILTFAVKAPGKYENCATVGVRSKRGLVETRLENNRDCARIEIDPRPVDVAIKKTAGGAKYDAQSDTWTIEFKLDVTNAGYPFSPGSAINIKDAVPAGLTFVGATGTNWQCPAGPPPPLASGNLECSYVFGSGSFGTGNHLNQLVVTATTKTAGKYENCATVGIAPEHGLHEVTLANNRDCATVETKSQSVDVAIAKTGTIGQPQAGPSPVSFTLAITNVGAAFTGANAITVTDVVPAGMTFNAATGPNWTCATLPVAAAGTMTCTYTGTGPAAVGATLGSITVSATATGDGPWMNCANVAVAPAAGVDSNLDNNKSCVTLTKGGFTTVSPPPPVPHVCGMNVIFVVDESGSIASPTNNTFNIQSALTSAASVLNVNSSKAALIHFSDNAQIVLPLSTSTYGSITTGYAPTGGTNWEAAMVKAQSVAASAGPNTIIVFITDGVPTAFLDNSGAVQFTTDSVQATNEAIPVVNQIYASGVPIIGIGIGGISTHLNALLGGNVSSTTYGGLNGTLTGLAKQLCPGLYLTKSISPSYINFHYTTSHQVPVTLSLTNTGGALTNVVVQDALPPELTNPTGFVVTAPQTASGNPVNWTIPALAAGATTTLTFQATITPSAPPPTTGTWHCIKNFAQVTSVGGVANIAADLMANPVTGPVHQPDEASAQVCVQNYVYPPPPGCTEPPTLSVKKSILSEVCRPAPQGGTSTNPCTFSVTVTANCKPFAGPVRLGEGVFAGTGPSAVTVPIASVTSVPVTACTWTSSTPSLCVANISLAAWQSMTFTVTLGGPIPDGSYRNCFLADGLSPAPADFNAAYTQVNPTTSSYGGLWGNCTPFIVANPQQSPTAPPPPPVRRVSTPPAAACVSPMVPGAAAGSCVCPQGTVQRGRECVRPQQPQACAAPFVPGAAAGSCVCPQGTTQQGRDCVKPQQPQQQTCAPPMVSGATAGSCVCPQGTVQRGRECVTEQRAAPQVPFGLPNVFGPGPVPGAGGPGTTVTPRKDEPRQPSVGDKPSPGGAVQQSPGTK